MTRELPEQLRLMDEMISETTETIDRVRERGRGLVPGTEPYRRMHLLVTELEKHLAALRLSHIAVQVECDKNMRSKSRDKNALGSQEQQRGCDPRTGRET
jgi:hypothetical protein